jgi:nucleoside diphosphate kinase
MKQDSELVIVQAALARLSRVDIKREVFAVDTYFLEGLGTFRQLCPGGEAALALGLTLVVAKPEAVVSRRVHLMADWLQGNGYQIVGAESLQFDRHLIRALWGHHWNAMTEDHKAVVDQLVQATPCMVFLVRDVQAGEQAALPAAIRFSRQKGPADPELRTPGQLRHALGFDSLLLNVVHSPDEPADVVRELAVLFDRQDRDRLLAAAVAGGRMADADLARRIEDLYHCAPYVDLASMSGGKPGATEPPPHATPPTGAAAQPTDAFWRGLASRTRATRSALEGVTRFIPQARLADWLDSPTGLAAPGLAGRE